MESLLSWMWRPGFLYPISNQRTDLKKKSVLWGYAAKIPFWLFKVKIVYCLPVFPFNVSFSDSGDGGSPPEWGGKRKKIPGKTFSFHSFGPKWAYNESKA